MKKNYRSYLALLLALSVPSTQVYATTKTMSVAQAFQELQYKLSVEWDQKDVAFKNNALKTFSKQLKALESQGVTQEEIVQELKAQAVDAQTAKELDQIAQIAKDQKLSKTEVQKLVTDYMAKTQKKGSSWSDSNGEAVIIGIVVLFIVLIIVASAANGVPYYDDGYYDDGYYEDCYYDWYWDEYVCEYY